MKIRSPFLPLRVETENLSHTVHIVGRTYTFGPDGMLSSIVSAGRELLAAPMRIVMREDGGDAVFDENYPENESESFIQRRSDEQAVICGCRQSERFILDFCNTVDYDGNIDIDMKLMTRGRTVAQVFGISEVKPLQYILDQLWLEVPLKAEHCTFYNMHPNSETYFEDGTTQPMENTTTSGRVPEKNASMLFKDLLWLGNDDCGLGWFAENDRHWQPSDPKHAIEIIHSGDAVILRIRLLDSHPRSWTANPERGNTVFTPIDFHFGFHATPVKPFPKNPYLHNALHLDCGIKIKGNYMDFMAAENRFDRLTEMGVDTLILHEKWNKSQNWFELSEFTAKQLRYITDECHKRGIKVMPYFGYEISTMSPVWSEMQEHAVIKNEKDVPRGGWWRVPFQRAYNVCYNSDYADCFIDGIANILDEYNLDGVYLDGTAMPRLCYNTEHGCGWYDEDGKLHGSYPLKAIRRLFKRLYEVVKSRGGMISVHSFAILNFTAMPYFDQNWFGENLQKAYMQGCTDDVNLDYFRTEYTGRNMGVPVEFLAYENRPLWKFESALSCAVLHGILPRPNDIGHPLTLMSGVWKTFGRFPIAQSEWMPYWQNEATSTHEKVKISYYRYTDPAGDAHLLAFAVNISAEDIPSVSVSFPENLSSAVDTANGREIGFTFSLEPFACRILYIR